MLRLAEVGLAVRCKYEHWPRAERALIEFYSGFADGSIEHLAIAAFVSVSIEMTSFTPRRHPREPAHALLVELASDRRRSLRELPSSSASS